MKNDKIFAWINHNIQKTIKPGVAGLKPITSPCIDAGFLCFFYWDTYFANLALLNTNNEEQVRNNLENMQWFVDRFGFIPNAYQPEVVEDDGTNRSQPPLFARGVWDYYSEKKDVGILAEYLPAIEKEYAFWQANRKTPCGLNRYFHHATDEYLLSFYKVIMERLQLEEGLYPNKLEQATHFLAIAESGWDFTCRFPEGDNAYACANYAPVDLNSILYDVECVLAQGYALLGDDAKAQAYETYAEERKEKMNKYMLADDGIYYDYNFVTGKRSPYISGASFYPFAMGVSKDVKSLEKVVAILEEEHGLSACEKKDRNKFDQWDFPYMWAPIVYFCVTALKKLNSKKFNDIANKYLTTVRSVYEKTGVLWEKYDSVKGEVGVSHEYQTPPMMGWTAGVYVYILKLLGEL